MGAIQSFIRDIYLSLRTLFATLSEMNKDFTALLSRINANPGLPVANSTSPFWLTSPPFPELTNKQSKALPETSDIVIIGSGITGASIAFTILEECKAMGIEKRVLMLEARQITSGATGRNGGHIKTTPYELFGHLKSKLGVERAKVMVKFNMRMLRLLPVLARQKKWEMAEAREVETVDLYTDNGTWLKARDMVRDLEVEMPEYAKDTRVWDAKEARENFLTGNHVLGAISYTAGALWPFRFVTSCLSYLLSTFPSTFTIETSTPASNITVSQDATRPYLIQTPRGTIKTSHIIHATEAHSATLIPGLRGKLIAVRGHMSAQRPGASFPKYDGHRSWSFMHAKGFDYITQRPGMLDGDENGLGAEIMAGGGLMLGGKGMDDIGVATDDDMRLDVGAYLGGILPMIFGSKNWGADAEGGRVKDLWTGTMGWSADGFPFVGRLDADLTRRSPPRAENNGVSCGEWITAGYGGEGMPQAWLCGVACALMVLGREEVELADDVPGRPEGRLMEWFPRELIITAERVRRANVNDLADEL